ncbi:DHA2 family efflux MFS transporter permease subunit [Labrys wisconsinensis]|uniref:EmrB/QacA subfamily drug resistance transporter n=1 Tax=Labrys wisconsinensis TaxID=425677 RepID=A0ABU0J9V7_9HYPH|nr:DHA2 family efflux MFS transporter permease subunit [Labrys wisconsinensis]MDQ0470341.1 EmrB/QacA subfamily drug resistance transporter [Labrys wisconsinensis]
MTRSTTFLPSGRLLPVIIATGLFMENLDATVLSTALPTIARDFGTSPIHLKLALTSYLLALAIFIPASGWMADRFGARTVFRGAIVVFGAGSIACGLSNGLTELVAARVLQGVGGAMMVPVGRLIILKTTPKHDLVNAMAWLTIPALLGPVTGPPLGGFITTYFSWRWIFWINIPIAVLGIVLASLFVPNVREDERRPFDLLGFVLVGPGLAALLTGATLAGLGLVEPSTTLALVAGGVVLLALFVRHALVSPAPIIELKLLRFPTFRASVVGGFLFRVGVGATPFLLPLLFQLGFNFTPFESGLLTLSTGLGAMAMKTLASTVLRRYGFRTVLVANAVLSSAFVAAPALFHAGMPVALIAATLLAGGFVRSLQFTSVNVSAVAEVPDHLMGRVTSFTAVLQELSGSVGVSVAALGLQASQSAFGSTALTAPMFPPVFLLVGGIAALSTLLFLQLPRDAGSNMLAPAERPVAARAAATAPEPLQRL